MRVTMAVRNLDGLKAKLRAKNRAAKERLKAAVVEQAEAVLREADERCPRDTEFMAQRLRLEFTREGYNWNVGFRAEDFVGHLNPVSKRQVTAFYPVFVILGTRFQTGNDFLSAVLRSRKKAITAAYAAALKG